MAITKLIADSITSGAIASTPYFFVNKSGNQATTDGADTKITFDNVVFDTDSGYDNTTNYRYTIPTGKDGKYFFFFHVQVSSATASQARDLNVRVRKNGSNIFHAQEKPYINDSTRLTMSGSIIEDCSAGDYFEVAITMDTGSGTVSIEAYTKGTSFGGYKIIE